MLTLDETHKRLEIIQATMSELNNELFMLKEKIIVVCSHLEEQGNDIAELLSELNNDINGHIAGKTGIASSDEDD